MVREGPILLAQIASRGMFQTPPHIQLLNRAYLEALLGIGPDQILVTLPPRHGKSTFDSKWIPAWTLGVFPDRPIILTSYEGDFAAEWGRSTRDVLEEWGEPIFGITVRPDSSAASRFGIVGHEGGMRTAGVGGAITGKGGWVLLCDDPVKNRAEAESPKRRQDVWEWWQSTFITRREPGGVVMVTMTRWHPDDLAGRLVAHEPGRWRVIHLPAIALVPDPERGIGPDLLGRAPGRALWPERYNEDALARIERTVGSFWWNALYLGLPIARRGGYFRREWFELVEQAPADARRVRYWDMAATEEGEGSSDPDWTVGLKLAAKGGMWWVEDVIRRRVTPGVKMALVRQTAELDGPEVRVWIEQEPGSSGKDVVAAYRRALIGYPVRGLPSTGSKTLRADPVASQAEGKPYGNVKVCRGGWVSEFLSELEAFPKGAHDDQVDALSGAFQALRRPLLRA
jgi:predicted phage terminase large subunit-like protein